MEMEPKKEQVNIVFIGHVDAGKSTIGGQILYLTGQVDQRTIERQREAAGGWHFNWSLDTNQEERERGKTVETGRGNFETEKKHYTILDAPGHKLHVRNMISGAAQADLAVLVISARLDEFETGFERGGQTREHAMLVRSTGVKSLIVLINKMDDPTVNWSEDRFSECRRKLIPYLKRLGFDPAKDLYFMPCSGLTGAGLLDPVDENICGWYKDLPFIPFLDSLPSLNRNSNGPFILPIADKYKDMGVIIMGKIESGQAIAGQQLIMMPNQTLVTVHKLKADGKQVTSAGIGENVSIKLKGIEGNGVTRGFVLCELANPCGIGKVFDAKVSILEHKSIICSGFAAVIHIHCAVEEILVKALICLVDKQTGAKFSPRPRFVKPGQMAIIRFECAGIICMETFQQFPQMGRFTLRSEDKTIAAGKILKIIN